MPGLSKAGQAPHSKRGCFADDRTGSFCGAQQRRARMNRWRSALGWNQKGDVGWRGDSVGGTPTDAVETTALPGKSAPCRQIGVPLHPRSSPGGRGKSNRRSWVEGWSASHCSRRCFEIRGRMCSARDWRGAGQNSSEVGASRCDARTAQRAVPTRGNENSVLHPDWRRALFAFDRAAVWPLFGGSEHFEAMESIV